MPVPGIILPFLVKYARGGWQDLAALTCEARWWRTYWKASRRLSTDGKLPSGHCPWAAEFPDVMDIPRVCTWRELNVPLWHSQYFAWEVVHCYAIGRWVKVSFSESVRHEVVINAYSGMRLTASTANLAGIIDPVRSGDVMVTP